MTDTTPASKKAQDAARNRERLERALKSRNRIDAACLKRNG